MQSINKKKKKKTTKTAAKKWEKYQELDDDGVLRTQNWNLCFIT